MDTAVDLALAGGVAGACAPCFEALGAAPEWAVIVAVGLGVCVQVCRATLPAVLRWALQRWRPISSNEE